MKHIWVFLILAFCLTGSADELAITFDDLPGQQVFSADKQRDINERILVTLDEFHAPAIGFVNEGKLYQTNQFVENIAILNLWIEHGQPLGNHTYSHHHLSDTPLDSFEQDVIKGAIVSRKLMQDAGQQYQYFRHPFLDTGDTPDRRNSFEAFLVKEGYVIAPVTIDTDDWQFNQQLIAHPVDKSQIIKAYLEHTRKKFDFYKKASERMFGRNIQHIWLLHVNELNAIVIHDLLKIAKNAGYEFITLEDALKDKAYAEPNRYYSRFGVSWLYRWDFTRGKVVDWSKEPEPNG